MAFGLILVLHVVVRTRFINHQLILDEANNFLCLNTLGGRFPGYPFNLMFNYHPPLYLVFALALSRITGIYTMGFYEGFSIVLSALSLFPLYLLSREIFSRRTALLSCFALALMPAAMVMDTWIKVDPLEVLFALWFVYFFVKGRPLVSGIFFALALLSKETVLLVAPGLVVYLLLSRDWRRLKALLFSSLIGALLSCWWFIFYYDNLGRSFSVLLSTHRESLMDDFGTWYYVIGLVRDCGAFLLVAASGGIAYCCYCFWAKKNRLAALPCVCFIAVYVFLSFIKGKPPWMITAVLPFIAILCGAGLNVFLEAAAKKGRGAFIIAATAIISAGIISSCTLSYDGYMYAQWDEHYRYAKNIRAEAEKIEKIFPDKAPFLIYFGDKVWPNPVFLSYIAPRNLQLISGHEPFKETADILDEKGINGAVISGDSLGQDIAGYLDKKCGFVFDLTEFFLIGKRSKK